MFLTYKKTPKKDLKNDKFDKIEEQSSIFLTKKFKKLE